MSDRVPYYVYILRSLAANRLYVGTSDDVTRRLKEHNQGLSRSTRPWRPWQLVHNERHGDLSSARRREWQLKCTPAGGKERKRLAARGMAAERGGG
jgi:putative endonuclease